MDETFAFLTSYKTWLALSTLTGGLAAGFGGQLVMANKLVQSISLAVKAYAETEETKPNKEILKYLEEEARQRSMEKPLEKTLKNHEVYGNE